MGLGKANDLHKGILPKCFYWIQQIQWQKYIVIKRAWTCNLLCRRQECYHSSSKTHVRDRIFQLSPIDASVIYQITWILITRVLLHLGKTPVNSIFNSLSLRDGVFHLKDGETVQSANCRCWSVSSCFFNFGALLPVCVTDGLHALSRQTPHCHGTSLQKPDWPEVTLLNAGANKKHQAMLQRNRGLHPTTYFAGSLFRKAHRHKITRDT